MHKLASGLGLATILDGGGSRALPFPQTQDFSTNPNLSGWTRPGGNAAVVGGVLVISPTVGPTELATDPGMETWTDTHTLTNWTKSVGGTSSLNQEDAAFHGGAHAARLDIDAGGDSVSLVQTILTVDSWYRGTMWAKVNSVAGSLRIGDLNNSYIITMTAAYAQYTTAFRATHAQVLLQRGTAPSKSLYVDDVSFQLINLASMGIYRRKPSIDYRVLVLPATIVACNPFGLWYTVDNPSAPLNGISAYHDGVNKLYFKKRLNGATSDIIAATTIAYNAASKVEVRGVGTTLQLFYGSAQQGADTVVANDAAFQGAYCGIFNSYSGNSIKSFELLTNP